MIQGYEKVFDTSAIDTQEIVVDNLTPYYNDWHFSINCHSVMFDPEEGSFFNSVQQTMQMTLNTIVSPETINAHFQTITHKQGNTSLFITGNGVNGEFPTVGRYYSAPFTSAGVYGNINVYVSRVLTSETNGGLFSFYSQATYADPLQELTHSSECWGVYQSHDSNLNYLKSVRFNVTTFQKFLTFQLTGYGRL